MTKKEFDDWCKDNNVPDDAVIVRCTYNELEACDEYELLLPSCIQSARYSNQLKRRLGITDTTPMVIEL